MGSSLAVAGTVEEARGTITSAPPTTSHQEGRSKQSASTSPASQGALPAADNDRSTDHTSAPSDAMDPPKWAPKTPDPPKIPQRIRKPPLAAGCARAAGQLQSPSQPCPKSAPAQTFRLVRSKHGAVHRSATSHRRHPPTPREKTQPERPRLH